MLQLSIIVVKCSIFDWVVCVDRLLNSDILCIMLLLFTDKLILA